MSLVLKVLDGGFYSLLGLLSMVHLFSFIYRLSTPIEVRPSFFLILSSHMVSEHWVSSRTQVHVQLYLVMDIMWPISQSHFHVSCLCSLK